MSAPPGGSSNNAMPRLGPAWRSSGTGVGRGFQPPPAVPDERSASNPRERSGSHASGGSAGESKGKNPFAMLDDEDENGGSKPSSTGERHTISSGTPTSGSGGGGRFSSLRPDNHSAGSAIQTSSSSASTSTTSRPYHRASSTGAKPAGRSLADLAAGLGPSSTGGGTPHHRSERPHRDVHGDHHPREPRGGNDHHSSQHEGGGGRDPRSMPRSSSSGMSRNRSGSGDAGLGVDGVPEAGVKVIRYTREKLLSLRGRGDEGPPECMESMEGSVVISKEPQDPVCWDTFDAEEIWAAAARDRRAAQGPGPESEPRGRQGTPKGSTSHRMMRDMDSGDEGSGGPPPPRGSLRGERGSLGDRGGVMGDRDPRGSLGDRDPRGPLGDRGGGGGGGFGAGRWQRGVALPSDAEARPTSRGRAEPQRNVTRNSDGYYEGENPDDLWDDPTAGGVGGTGAAADFSAFGGSLDDEIKPKGQTGMDAFEMSDMSKAAEAFEKEMHGGARGEVVVGGLEDNNNNNNDGALESALEDSGNGAALEEEGDEAFDNAVDPTRPLAGQGTTIRSGSGDNVNVFEDFGDEASQGEDGALAPASAEGDNLPIKSGKEEKGNASSRLMKMIGVAGTGEAAAGGIGGGDPEPMSEPPEEAAPEESGPEDGKKPRSDSIVSSNPWGAPAATTGFSVSSNPWGDSGGMAGSTLDSFAPKEAEAASAQRQQEELRQRQLQQQQQQQQQQQAQAEEEEKKRWAAMQAKQAAEMQAQQQQAAAAQQAAQAQQQQRQQAENQVKAQQNQVELVLIERISNILENSWGRSDLNSILSTLHANDSRVIAILSTTEALRALVARHPQRIQLGRDPTMGAEMAALRLTNAQWAQHQAQQQAQEMQVQQAQAAAQAEQERRRQLQEQQAQAAAQQEAMARQAQLEAEEKAAAAAAESSSSLPPVIADAPWFYADPQGNIQGPFSGDEMRQWLEAGYFKGDLPISQNGQGPFRPLGNYFSDSATAFQPTVDTAAEEARARAEAEAAEQEARMEAKARVDAEVAARAEAEAAAQRQQAEAEEAAARREAETKACVEAEAKAHAQAKARSAEAKSRAAAKARAEAQAAKAESESAQLKMMLGLGATEGSLAGGEGGGVNIAGPPEPVVAEPPVQKGKKSKKKQQQQAQQPAPEPVVVAQPPAPEPVPAAPPAPAWGGVAAKPPAVGRKKSMSEIQREEAKEAMRIAAEQGITLGGPGYGRTASGGWANIAASGGSTAWGGAVKPGAAGVAPAGGPVVVVGGLAGQKPEAQAAWNKPSAPAAGGKKQPKGISVASNKKASSAASVDNFGTSGKMTLVLETWCKDQMLKLNNTTDLTLVSFCMTLTDKDEIRQYLTAYLGSTPQVNSFATEFIKRNGLGDNGKQEEWESAGGPKKGRKKKGGK